MKDYFLPKSIDDFNGERLKTLKGEDIMLGSKNDVFFFSTNNNFTIIAETLVLYMDGTFQIVLIFFYKVFTLYSFRLDHLNGSTIFKYTDT